MNMKKFLLILLLWAPILKPSFKDDPILETKIKTPEESSLKKLISNEKFVKSLIEENELSLYEVGFKVNFYEKDNQKAEEIFKFLLENDDNEDGRENAKRLHALNYYFNELITDEIRT